MLVDLVLGRTPVPVLLVVTAPLIPRLLLVPRPLLASSATPFAVVLWPLVLRAATARLVLASRLAPVALSPFLPSLVSLLLPPLTALPVLLALVALLLPLLAAPLSLLLLPSLIALLLRSSLAALLRSLVTTLLLPSLLATLPSLLLTGLLLPSLAAPLLLSTALLSLLTTLLRGSLYRRLPSSTAARLLGLLSSRLVLPAGSPPFAVVVTGGSAVLEVRFRSRIGLEPALPTASSVLVAPLGSALFSAGFELAFLAVLSLLLVPTASVLASRLAPVLAAASRGAVVAALTGLVARFAAIEPLRIPVAVVSSARAFVLVRFPLVSRAVGASVATPLVVWIVHGVLSGCSVGVDCSLDTVRFGTFRQVVLVPTTK